MTDKEKLSCLTDRPCSVCKHKTENGCTKWACVFEEESDSADIEKAREEIEKIRAEVAEEACLGMNDRYCQGLYKALRIIDKHIGGKDK